MPQAKKPAPKKKAPAKKPAPKKSSRVSGLNDQQAAHARELIIKASRVMVRNARQVHYSQGGDRWEGIRNRLTITRGQIPLHCDCSSTAYWMLWDALGRAYGLSDYVGHSGWAAGYTGTMYKSGKAVVHDANLKVGDLIFYGDQGGGIPEHVAVYVGGGHVFSHGSEGGPYILNIDYRGDRRRPARRFI